MDTTERQIIDGTEALEAAIARARAAEREFSLYTQEKVDAIFKAAAIAANMARVPLAKMAVEETGMGVVEDKVIKNNYAAEYIYNAYKNTKTRGVIAEDPGDVVAADALQEPADFRLEDDHQGQQPQLHRLAEHKVYGVQVKLVGQPHNHKDQQQGLGHLGGVGPLEDVDALVNHIGQNDNIQKVGNGDKPQGFCQRCKILNKGHHTSTSCAE